MARAVTLLWLLVASQSVWAASDSFCSQVPGHWKGLIEAPEHSYSWTAKTLDDGSFAADFRTLYADGSSRHSSQRGTWRCADGIFTTEAVDAFGNPLVFRYKILRIDRNHMVYRILWGDEPGTVFGSTRVK
ncbi:MAG: hypothetical protein AAF458_05655 [Pseudomonadota bacterium]